MFDDTIRSMAVIAPAGSSEQDVVLAGVEFLRAAGLRISYRTPGAGYPSVSAEKRAAELSCWWLDPGTDALIAARGGYGCAGLLDLLDWNALRKVCKPVIGYSDLTALHFGMLSQRAGRPIAGIMSNKLAESVTDELTRRSFSAAVAGRAFTIERSRYRVLQSAGAEGLPLAGNLAVAVSLCGTKWFPECAGRILVLEDLNEPIYKLDRYLTQLTQCGVFERCAGVIFGHFTQCGLPEEREALFRRVARQVHGPVIADFPFGHVLPFCSLDLTCRIAIAPDEIRVNLS